MDSLENNFHFSNKQNQPLHCQDTIITSTSSNSSTDTFIRKNTLLSSTSSINPTSFGPDEVLDNEYLQSFWRLQSRSDQEGRESVDLKSDSDNSKCFEAFGIEDWITRFAQPDTTTIKSEPYEEDGFVQSNDLIASSPDENKDQWLCSSENSFQSSAQSDERRHKCNDCGKAFRQLSTLAQHRVIHSVARPFKCEVCSKTFNRASTLISHRKTHSEVKPFKCHLCDKGFHQKGNLRNHIYIHNNERPYRCSHCHKGFNQMSNLMCHKQKIHAADLMPVWACHRCDAAFQKRNLLRQHELDTHQIRETMKSSKKRYITKRSYDAAFSTASTITPILTASPPPPPPAVPPAPIKSKSHTDTGILIPAIRTDAWTKVHKNGGIPFAILNLFDVMPLLVRIFDCKNGKSLLRTATEEDIHACRNYADRATVPIVATVTQVVDDSGKVSWSVLPPKNIYKFQADSLNLMLQYGSSSKVSGNGGGGSVAASTTMNEPPTTIRPLAEEKMYNTFSAKPMMGKASTPIARPVQQELAEHENLSDADASEAIKSFATGCLLAPIKLEQDDVSLKGTTSPASSCTGGISPFEMFVAALQSDGQSPDYEKIQEFIMEYELMESNDESPDKGLF